MPYLSMRKWSIFQCSQNLPTRNLTQKQCPCQILRYRGAINWKLSQLSNPDKRRRIWMTFNFQSLLMSADIVSGLWNIWEPREKIHCVFNQHLLSSGILVEVPSPTSSILLIYFRKGQFSWQKDIWL